MWDFNVVSMLSTRPVSLSSFEFTTRTPIAATTDPPAAQVSKKVSIAKPCYHATG